MRWGGTSVSAVLGNTQQDLGSAINSFTTPNISAAYAPDYLMGMYSTMPMSTESYMFNPGAAFGAHLENGNLVGSVSGIGSRYTAIFFDAEGGVPGGV